MCGRFQLSVKGKHISERINVEVFDEMFSPNFNCAPSQKLPVITYAKTEKLSFFQWGLIPFWAKDPKIGFKLINARAETIAERRKYFPIKAIACSFRQYKNGGISHLEKSKCTQK